MKLWGYDPVVVDENFKRLTESLPSAPNLPELIGGTSGSMVEYKLDDGTCLGFALYNNGAVSVQRAFLSKDGHFPVHFHKDRSEVLVVVQGKMKVRCGDFSKILEAGDFVFFPKSEEHETWAIEDTWMIGIEVPGYGGGYPDAGKHME